MDDTSFLSIVPPLVTIILAVSTRNVLLSLGLGVLLGMTIHHGFNPIDGVVGVLEDGVFAQFSKGSNAQILILIAVIGGFVYQLDGSGGMRAFANFLARGVRTRAKAQVSVLVSGVAIFFTDSGNPLILGPVFRPIFDRFRICREKLAFIIDATSSPVCVLIPFIGWGVYIMSLITEGFAQLPGTQPEEVDAFEILIEVLPFQFYPFLALASVVIFTLVGRDFGPMRRAQAYAESKVGADDAVDEEQDESGPSAKLVVLPLVAVFASMAVFFTSYRITLGNLPGSKIRTSLVISYLLGAVVCAWMSRRETKTPLAESWGRFMTGMQRMLPILLILIFAWSLGDVCRLLNTSGYLASLIGDDLPPGLLPPILFVLGGVIALSTGSSYGTFAILMPIAISLGDMLGAPMSVTIAAVLSGGILGDHASPISDTTILSSMATGCEHADHVRTQLPYALLTGLAALLAFIVAGQTGSAWSIVVGLAALVVLIVAATRVGRDAGATRASD